MSGNGGAEELRIELEAEELKRRRTFGKETNRTCTTKDRNDSFLRGLRGAFGWRSGLAVRNTKRISER
jgi:hypothetical protein